MSRGTVVVSINASWNIINFRTGLIRGLQKAGYEVVAMAPTDGFSPRFEALDVEHVPIAMDSQGVSPLRDLALLARYRRTLGRVRPAVFLGFTAKPNVYGSLAARSVGARVINNVSGLGTAFIRQGLLTRIVSSLYRLAFRGSSTVFFQNRDDRDLFLAKKLVRPGQAKLLPGSGIDTARFSPPPEPAGEDRGPVTFLLVARLLLDKGVGEYVEAARRVRAARPDIRFRLLGFLDVANRTAVTREEVDRWVGEGAIDYLGSADDVRPFIASADCLVLPSYREGLPRTLLEGAAMARPLIATDVPGCRDVVRDGENGFLCRVRDPASLAEAMLKMADLSLEERRRMGRAARARIEAEFDERIVVERYLEAIEQALRV